MTEHAAGNDEVESVDSEESDEQPRSPSPRRRAYPRLLIPGAEACRRIKRALGCDSGEALSWLKHQVRRTVIEAHKGNYHLAYHERDESDEANAAFWHLEHPLSPRNVDEDKELDWSIVSIDEGDLKKALAAELVDPNEPIGADPPPRPSLVFAVAVEKVRAASGFGEDAARDWLFDALFVQPRIPAWTRPTRRYPRWQLAKAPADLSLVYVMTTVLEEALAVELPRAEDRPTSTSVAVAPGESQRYDPESLCIEWLKSEMLKSLDRSPKPKKNWRIEAKKRFPGLSDRAFDGRAWPEAIVKTRAKWSKPGPKSSR